MNQLVSIQPVPAPATRKPVLKLVTDAQVIVAPVTVSLRPARLEDVPQMFAMLDDYARRGLMLSRTVQDVYRNVREFVVAVDEHDNVLGCGGLRIYSPVMGEIIALAVAERCHGMGVGRMIVERLIGEARGLDMCRVFAMTLQEGFFNKLGFATTHITEFPEKITFDCSRCAKKSNCIEIAVAIDL